MRRLRNRAAAQRTHQADARERIYATVDAIPRGKVATYGGVARLAGLPGRARLVGRLLGELPNGTRLPWHRVLNSQGRISAREGDGPAEQRRRLVREGVPVSDSGRVALRDYEWTPSDDVR